MDDFIWVPGHGAIGPEDSPSMWLDDGDVAGVPARAEKWGGGNVANDNTRPVAPATRRAVRWGEPPWPKDLPDNRPRPWGSHDRGPYIATHTGRFYMTDPRPEDFRIEDVAHGLANICRYTGACKRHYSVAEHSVHIADWLLKKEGCKRLALIGLLHDAPEALSGFGDVSRPAKQLAPVIKETEDNIWRRAVAPKFGLPTEIPAIVHEVDGRIIADEMTQNMNECDPKHNNPLGIRLEFWSPAFAKAVFLMRFNALTFDERIAKRQDERSAA